MSARRLWVLIRQLPIESALVRALNGGRTPWGDTEHLLADLWAQQANAGRGKGAAVVDHPTRAKREAEAREKAKQVKVAGLRAEYEARKRKREQGRGVG